MTSVTSKFILKSVIPFDEIKRYDYLCSTEVWLGTDVCLAVTPVELDSCIVLS